MMNNNHKKSGCDFAEDLVSYIYGETNASAKAEFERHLAACSICADELEAFSGVHFAIGDWKALEFDALETPAVEIPYPQTEKEVLVGKGSWLPALLRDLFSSYSPRALSLATACVAVLAVAGGAVLFILNSNGGKDIAGKNKNSNPAVVPTVEKTPAQANVNQNNSPTVEPKQQQPNVPQPEVVRQPETKTDRAVKIVNNPRTSPKAENPNTPKSSDVKRNNKSNQIKTQEIPDEDEDDTLRLAELFEEIDARD